MEAGRAVRQAAHSGKSSGIESNPLPSWKYQNDTTAIHTSVESSGVDREADMQTKTTKAIGAKFIFWSCWASSSVAGVFCSFLTEMSAGSCSKPRTTWASCAPMASPQTTKPLCHRYPHEGTALVHAALAHPNFELEAVAMQDGHPQMNRFFFIKNRFFI